LWLHLLTKLDLIDELAVTTGYPPDDDRNPQGSKEGEGEKGKKRLYAKLRLIEFDPASSYTYRDLQSTTYSPRPSPGRTMNSIDRDREYSPASYPYYSVTWTRNSSILASFTNRTTLILDDWTDEEVGHMRVSVQLFTPDVRKDDEGKLTSQRTF
jgi:hypothetical protein